MSFSHIITSQNDHRKYQHITLNNGLRVLLIEDPKEKNAAASLTINMGYFDDPSQRQGLTHFIEHLLFLGTEKYPQADEFNNFIKQNSGRFNAWTGSEYSTYYFFVSNNAFHDALARFSQFFLAPLFDPTMVGKERNAIDSEFKLMTNEDNRRILQVIKETANQAHPFTKFSGGNLETLAGDTNQLHQELQTFFKENISANLMTLCLSSSHEINELQEMAQKYFGNIQNKNLIKKYPQVPLYLKDSFNKQIFIKTIKDQKILSLCFTMPNLVEFYRTKPLSFISHLICYESENSLALRLKQLNLIHSITTGIEYQGYNFTNYSIKFRLTTNALEKIPIIIIETFQYLNIIQEQGLVEWRYHEKSDLLKLAFKYKEKMDVFEYITNITNNMQCFKTEDVIYSDYCMAALDTSQCNYILSFLTLDNAQIRVIQNNDIYNFNKYAKWYNTEYACYNFNSVKYPLIQQPNYQTPLSLPPENIYLVKDPKLEVGVENKEFPSIISQANGYRIWHKKEKNYQVPKGVIYLSIDSKYATNTCYNAALTQIYVEILNNYLEKYFYAAEVAGIEYDIYTHQAGIGLCISGFTDKQEQLLNLIIEKSRYLSFSTNEFIKITNKIKTTWQNWSKNKPITQLIHQLLFMLQDNCYSPTEKINEIENLIVDDIYKHINLLFNKIFLEGMIYGNWSETNAIKMSSKITKLVSTYSSPGDPITRQITIPKEDILERSINIQSSDQAVIYYLLSNNSKLDTGLFILTSHILSPQYFNQLRTNRQLGYLVGLNYYPINNIPGMLLYVQSSTASVELIKVEIEQFIKEANDYLTLINTNILNELKNEIILKLKTEAENLYDKGEYFWSCIGNNDYNFNFNAKLIDEITQIEPEHIISFYNKLTTDKKIKKIILYTDESK